jgi:hypothetical protein
MKTFEQKIAEVTAKMRTQNLFRALELIQSAVSSGEILSISFTATKQWGEETDPIVIDYSVDLSNGKNIADLGAESFEDAITEIATGIKEKLRNG